MLVRPKLPCPRALCFARVFSTDIRKPHSVLVAVGDLTHGELKQKLAKAVAGWTPSGDVDPGVSLKAPKQTTVTVDRDLTQSSIVMGHEGPLRMDPDHYAIRVMNQILGGGGLTSRLGERIRTRQGLAYSVYTALSPMASSALLQGGVGTDTCSDIE